MEFLCELCWKHLCEGEFSHWKRPIFYLSRSHSKLSQNGIPILYSIAIYISLLDGGHSKVCEESFSNISYPEHTLVEHTIPNQRWRTASICPLLLHNASSHWFGLKSLHSRLHHLQRCRYIHIYQSEILTKYRAREESAYVEGWRSCTFHLTPHLERFLSH